MSQNDDADLAAKRLALIAAFDPAWRAVDDALQSRDPAAPLHDPEQPAWTVRDVYAHLARWLRFAHDEIARHLAGEKPTGRFDTDARNAEWQAADARLALPAARARAAGAVTDLVALLETLAADQWDGHVYRLANGNGPQHLDEHRAYLTPGSQD